MKNRVVVITGGTAGVGRITAIEFAKKGYSIAVLAREENRLKSTEKDIERHGGKGLGIKCDVAYYKQIEKAALKVEKKFGPINLWVNNATATVFSKVKDITPEEYKRVTDVTYLGTVYGTMVALKSMLPRNNGTIIQVGSALSYRAIPLQSAYCGSKHAIRGFTDSLRVELMHSRKKIKLTMVQLPGLNTPQFSWSRTRFKKHPQPVPPIFQPDIAARAILFATEHNRREIWVGRSSTATIIANKFFSGFVDLYLMLTGFDSQFTNKPRKRYYAGNLFDPIAGNFSSYGIFSKKSKKKSMQFEFEKIPFLHFFSDIFFAFIQFTTMIPKAVSKLFERKTSKPTAS